MIVDMLSNKIISFFITQYYFAIPKKYQTKFNTLFSYENHKQKKLKKIAFNHSSDIDFEDFMNLYKKFIEKIYSFSVIDTTVASDNSSRFRKNLLETI